MILQLGDYTIDENGIGGPKVDIGISSPKCLSSHVSQPVPIPLKLNSKELPLKMGRIPKGFRMDFVSQKEMKSSSNHN